MYINNKCKDNCFDTYIVSIQLKIIKNLTNLFKTKYIFSRYLKCNICYNVNLIKYK